MLLGLKFSFLGRDELLMNKKKNPIIKNQGWEPIHQKYKGKQSTKI
jgi:hypothetical protein